MNEKKTEKNKQILSRDDIDGDDSLSHCPNYNGDYLFYIPHRLSKIMDLESRQISRVDLD